MSVPNSGQSVGSRAKGTKMVRRESFSAFAVTGAADILGSLYPTEVHTEAAFLVTPRLRVEAKLG